MFKLIEFNANRMRRIFRSKLFVDQWILLFKLDYSSPFLNDLKSFVKILPPKDRIWADPHVIKNGDRFYIFFEVK